MPTPPLFAQEKDDTCALACLRMILADNHIAVTEEELEKRANKETGGIEILELQRLARGFGLKADILRLDVEAIAAWLARKIFPIVYLNRVHFDQRSYPSRQAALQNPIVHAVVPIRVSKAFVTINDPLPPAKKRRILKRKFADAQADLEQLCLVCGRGSL